MEKIKIVQVGVTHEHASGKISTLIRLPDLYEIVGVVDDSATSKTARYIADNWAANYEGIPRLTMEEALNYPGLQAAVIETANDDLVKTAMPFAEKGIPMHMDKPGGRSQEEFDRLVNLCEKKNVPFQMGYMFRGNPALNFISDLVKKGILGDVFELYADMNHNYGNEFYKAYLSSFPGGILYNLLCHPLDYVVSMLGAPEDVHHFFRNTPNYPAGSMNNCMTILEYPHALVNLRACSMDCGNERRLRVSGTNGVMNFCPMEDFSSPMVVHLKLKEERGGFPAGMHTFSFPVMSDRYRNQFIELAKIIRKEIPNPAGLYAHDRLVEKVLLAASGITRWQR